MKLIFFFSRVKKFINFHLVQDTWDVNKCLVHMHLAYHWWTALTNIQNWKIQTKAWNSEERNQHRMRNWDMSGRQKRYEVCRCKSGLIAQLWYITLKDSSNNDWSVQFILFDKWGRTIDHLICIQFTTTSIKKFRLMSACADCAGWHGSKFFEDALRPSFTDQSSYISLNTHPGCVCYVHS